ncbi:MAG: PatB family C-S lyase [Caldilineaceae bacterium]
MSYNFDEAVVRAGSDSSKWRVYGEDVIPMWVADMDFRSPRPILDAIHERVEHAVFGYGGESQRLQEVICERMDRLHGWQIKPADVVLLPGLVCGLNVVSRAIGQPGDGVVVSTPVYPPFLTAPTNQGRVLQTASLAVESTAHTQRYAFDADVFEQTIQPNTNLFILCNPHNPVGRAYTKAEMLAMAESCTRHDLVICSDEIHCDLMLDGNKHLPIATLDPQIADRTITLIAPSKTFNVPGLGCSAVIVQNAELRQKVTGAASGIVPHVNVLGIAAAIAAYTECQAWQDELLAYLTANRDFVVNFVTEELPNLRITVPEATYLAWIDCRAAGIEGNPYEFFLKEAKVAFNDGARFGEEGKNFIRLNFGTQRALLEEGLARVKNALHG